MFGCSLAQVPWLFWHNFDAADRETWCAWAEAVVARYPSLLFSRRGGATVLHELARGHEQAIISRLTAAVGMACTPITPFGFVARTCGTTFGGVVFPNGSARNRHAESPLDIVLSDSATLDEKYAQALLENCAAAPNKIPGWRNPTLLEERTLIRAFDLLPDVAADFLMALPYAGVESTLQQPRKFNFSAGGAPGAFPAALSLRCAP